MWRPLVHAILVLAMLCFAKTAHADSIGDLIKNLDSDAKNVRLAAVVALAKSTDSRIILPFVKVLGNDPDEGIRQVAANGLGKMVTSTTKDMLKNLAVKTLKAAADTDSSTEVRKQAAAALTQITGAATSAGTTTTGPTTSGGGGGIYVNVGPMSSKTGQADDPKLRDIMVKSAAKSLTASAPQMAQVWNGKATPTPTKQELEKKGVSGFYVDGTLNEIKVNGMNISCKVSMLLASFPEKSVFGFLNGGATISASGPSDMPLARLDCVDAVVADLIKKQIIPTIKTKAH